MAVGEPKAITNVGSLTSVAIDVCAVKYGLPLDDRDRRALAEDGSGPAEPSVADGTVVRNRVEGTNAATGPQRAHWCQPWLRLVASWCQHQAGRRR